VFPVKTSAKTISGGGGGGEWQTATRCFTTSSPSVSIWTQTGETYSTTYWVPYTLTSTYSYTTTTTEFLAVPTTIPVTVATTELSSVEVPTTELSYVEVPTTIIDVESNFETIDVPTTIVNVETNLETLYVTETDYITSLTTEPVVTVFITSTLVETNTYTLPPETVTS
jgi:hypothetical protein